MIELARHYAKHGYRVFPLQPGGKKPVIPKERGGRGCLDGTLDLNKIEQWWAEWPDANVGIATGALLVIDVDPRRCSTWLESLNQLALPPTFAVKTWSGGWHLYLQMPVNAHITIGTDLLPAIDWRGRGGYVVAAGSVVNGVTYEIARNLPIAAPPRSLIERIQAHTRKRIVQRDEHGHMVIPDGNRNRTLFQLGCLLRRFGLGFNAVHEALRAANADHCDPGLADEELRQIAASAMRYSPKKGAS